MTDLGAYLTKTGSYLISENDLATGPSLKAWLKKDDLGGDRLIVPDVATLDTSDRSGRLHRIEADLMVRHRIGRGTQVRGVRVMVSATTSRDGWRIEGIEIHAPPRCFSDAGGWDVAVLAAVGMTENLTWCATLPIVAAVDDALRDEVLAACSPSAHAIYGLAKGRISDAWLAAGRDHVTGSMDEWRVDATMHVRIGNRQLLEKVVVHGIMVDHRPTISCIVAA